MQVLKKYVFIFLGLLLSGCQSTQTTSSPRISGYDQRFNDLDFNSPSISLIGNLPQEEDNSFRVGMLLPLSGKAEKYGQGFRLSRHYADEGFGYGCMPDITAHMTIQPSLVAKVLQKHSWIAILDACIGQYGSAQKNLTDEFVDCTGFSDTCWWVSVSDPAKWIDDMQSTLLQLAGALPEN